MRTPLLSLLVFSVLAACRCSPATPSPVVLRIKNSSKDAIFVDATGGKLGLAVQRSVQGQWTSFDDTPCPCQTCERVCDAVCTCPDAGTSLIRRIPPDGQAERTWSGVVQVSDVAACRGVAPCLSPENAPLNEPFTVQLCYANQVPGFITPDGGVGQGDFPRIGVTCVGKEFMPADGVVEVGPQRGAACTTSADCKGKDELCFDGACTASCPANDFPLLGSNWALYVASPDDRGFFTTSTVSGVTTSVGTGRLSSVVFQGNSMVLQLTRAGAAGEPLNATLSIGMPPGTGAPLTQGAQVTVKLIDASSRTNPGNRAVAVWELGTGALLFAADVGQEGSLLTSTDLTPFTVGSGTVPVGCRLDECGKLLFYATHFGGPSVNLDLEPGKAASVNTAAGTWRFLAVSNGAYAATTTCTLSDIRPWALWREHQ